MVPTRMMTNISSFLTLFHVISIRIWYGFHIVRLVVYKYDTPSIYNTGGVSHGKIKKRCIIRYDFVPNDAYNTAFR